ncbi:hypothetical protein ACTFIW_004863 [Dictyostelium discoideum]
MIRNIISKNNIITSISHTNSPIQTEKIIFNKTIIFNNNNNYNNDNNNNNNRTFFTNPQFQNKKYEIFQSLSKPHSLKDTYKILSEISLGSHNKAANIRISFFNQEKEKCDIRGVKLFSDSINSYFNVHDNSSICSEGWLVIIGGRGPSQWNNISLSLYLATILSQKPLTNFDVIIFPVENPIPIPNDTHNNKRQPLMMLENTISQHQSLNNSNFSSINQPQPLFDNYTKSNNKNNALNDWLMKSKKEFTQLKIDPKENKISPTTNKILPQHGGLFDIYETNTNNQSIKFFNNENNDNNNNINYNNNISIFNEGNQFFKNVDCPPNYILNLKDLNFHHSFNIDQLHSFGLNISKQIKNIDDTFDKKRFSPIQF